MAIAPAIRYSRWEHPEPGTRKSFLLSLAAHSLLALMFMVGLNWKTSSTPAGVEVELWDNSPPQVIETTPIEQVVPVINEKAEIVIEKKKVEPKVEPPKKVEVKPVTPPKPVEKEKPKAEVKPKPVPKVEPPKEKPKAKEEPKAPPVDAKQKAAEEKERADRIAKMRAEAGAESGGSGGISGSGNGAGGTASPRYSDKVRRAFSVPRINNVEGNPIILVNIQIGSDGRIISKRVIRSSGQSEWDKAVIQAIDDTGKIPSDNGAFPIRSFDLSFKPND